MVRRRSKRKPRVTRKDFSRDQQQHPTRKRGRPRKTVRREEKDGQGGSEEEQLEQNKKMKLETGLEDVGQHQRVNDEEESSAAEATADSAATTSDAKKEQAQTEEVKPKSRRKSQPRKST